MQFTMRGASCNTKHKLGPSFYVGGVISQRITISCTREWFHEILRVMRESQFCPKGERHERLQGSLREKKLKGRVCKSLNNGL